MVDAGVVGQHESADLVGGLDVGALLAEGDLDGGRPPVDEVCQFLLPDPLQGLVHLGRVHLPLDYVQDRHVLPLLGRGAHHYVGRVQQPPHHIEDRGFFDVGGLLLDGEGGIAGHEEVASGGGDEGGQQPGHVVVHVAGVAEGRGRGGHHGRHQGVYLAEVGVGYLQSFGSYLVQGSVVQDDYRVGVVDQPFEGQNRVIGLHHHVRSFLLVRKDRVRRYQLLRVLVAQLFQEKTAEPTAGSSCDGVQDDKALQGLGAIGLTVDHVEDLVLELFALGVAAGPAVAGPPSVLGDEDVLGVVEFGVGALADGVDDLGGGGSTLGSRSTRMDLGM